MRKIVIALVAVLVMFTGLSAAPRFSLSLAANIQGPSDAGYREIYGGSIFLPEVKAGIAVFPGFYLWTGYGRTAAEGLTPLLQTAADSLQHYLMFGLGYQLSLSEKLGLKAELGMADVLYRERALGETIRGSALGVSFSAGLTLALGKSLFLLAEAGFLQAHKKIGGVEVKMGGGKAGLGAGVRF